MQPARSATVAMVLVAAAACSSTPPAPSSGAVVESTASPESKVTVVAPTVSSEVTATGEKVASSAEVRVGEILSELQTAGTAEGTVITLPEVVLFDFGRADLKPDAKPTLSDVAEVIAFYGAAPVSVRGHTDSVGADDANQELSERRAASVVAALTGSYGVAASRLTAMGFGETQPVSPNANPDGSDNPGGRQQNRRVEIVLEGVTR